MTAAAFQKLTQGRVELPLLQWLSDEVELVEKELLVKTTSPVALISQVGRHTLKAGGKRLRPALVLASAKATGLPFDLPRARRYGCVMEMIHMASLIHDDVIDQSAYRRGQPTAHRLFGTTESVLSGDVLLARSMAMLTEDGDIDVTRLVSEAVVEVAEGEVIELETRHKFDLTEEEHLAVLNYKTGSFIRACCEVGARLAGATPEVQKALRDYGSHVGLAFQIADDLLDYRGKGAETGKPLAIDFRDGQATLPLIRLREKISEEESQVLRSRFGNGVSDDEVRMICGWMDTRGAFASVEQTALEEVKKAAAALEPLPEGPYKELLMAVGDYVIERKA